MRHGLALGLLLPAIVLCGMGCPVDQAEEVGFIDRAVRKDMREKLKDETCPEGKHVPTEAECAALRGKPEEPSLKCESECVPDR
jgi:hypothetical protein